MKTENNELVVIEESTALQAFSTENGLDGIVQQAKDLVAGFEHDMSTKASRGRTASLANKVAKLKVRLDTMGKDLVADWKTKAKAVDSNRKSMRDALDELKAEARKPLTDWEEEQARIEAEKAAAEEAARIRIEIEQAHEVAILMNEKFDRDLAERKAEEERQRSEAERIAEEWRKAREERIRLQAIEDEKRRAQEELDRIERERIAAEDRAAQAEHERIASEERARIRAEEEEKRRVAYEQEQVRLRAEAEDRAKREAEEAAERARKAEIERQHQEQIRIEKEAAAREADIANKKRVNNAIKDAFIAGGLNEEQAVLATKLLAGKKVPNVNVVY